MALNDGYMNSSGQISMGNTAGTSQSLLLFKAFRDGTSPNYQVSISTLRSFFTTYGMCHTVPATNSNVSFSSFRNALMYAMDLNSATSEQPSQYGTNNDGSFQVTPYGPGNFTFSGQLGGTVASGTPRPATGLNGPATYGWSVQNSLGCGASSKSGSAFINYGGTSTLTFDGRGAVGQRVWVKA